MTAAEALQARLRACALTDVPFNELSAHDRKLVIFYLTEALERTAWLWPGIQILLNEVLDAYTLQSIPLIPPEDAQP